MVPIPSPNVTIADAKISDFSGVQTKSVVSVEVIASSLLGIIMWWIKDGIQFSSEYIADQITAMYKKTPV